MNSGSPTSFIKSRRTVLVCLLLAAVTVAVYWQVSEFDFTNYDDIGMVLTNPFVLGGLTLKDLSWALTTSYFEYWHPLTWLSHMLDCQLFGLNAGGHHLVSLGFHVANTLLLLVVLKRMTRAFWRSAMVAALFALHPMHVESVAWIAERKDVLSAFFFMLTLWAYVRYVECGMRNAECGAQNAAAGSAARSAVSSSRFEVRPSARRLWYWLAVLMFALGLMSKPMVVTLPCVLLLLDYWPLGRFVLPGFKVQGSKLEVQCSAVRAHCPTSPLSHLVLEKLPFFALTVASCAITYLGAKAGGNMLSAEKVPWGLRLANVPVSYAMYLGKTIWPAELAVLYPLPSHLAWWQVSGALVVLGLCSLFSVALFRRKPWLAVGWCWFLGTLLPVIGVVQVGFHSMADRYSYIPAVGLFIALVWVAAEWTGGRGKGRGTRTSNIQPRTLNLEPGAAAGGEIGSASERVPAMLAGVAAVVLLFCGYLTWVQAGYWRNSFTLWTRALAVTSDNARAHLNYGLVLEQRGQMKESMEHYREALRIEPSFYEAHNNLGSAMYQLGQLSEATNHLMRALIINPNKSAAHVNLARALASLGDWSGVREHYVAAEAADPQNPAIPSHWGKTLLMQNQAKEALERFGEALKIDPDFAEAIAGCGFALGELGSALAAQGKLDEAAQHYREALRLQPDVADVLNNLAWLLATANDARLRNGAEAVRSAKRACELTHYQQVMLVGTLAAAYAENSQFEEARSTAQKAIALAEASGQAELAAKNRELLRLYEAGRPCRQ